MEPNAGQITLKAGDIIDLFGPTEAAHTDYFEMRICWKESQQLRKQGGSNSWCLPPSFPQQNSNASRTQLLQDFESSLDEVPPTPRATNG